MKMMNAQPALAVLFLTMIGLMVSCGNGSNSLPQFDRTAIPGVNTAVIPAASKDAFNVGDPATDAVAFQAIAMNRIDQLRAAVNSVMGFPPEDAPGLSSQAVAGVLVPDVLTIDFSQPTAFPNGRGLPDDVIDAALGLVLNRGNPLGGGGGISDGIANDSAFLAVFPYLAPAQ
ncbi:MAG: DUF4331 family protein [Planctomycetes bacterium]|nr:DUF4331 family protein [Planctomycetota bacterium]